MSKASDTAYQEIRRRILTGELPANSQLTERELALICGVSRTPVRDALRRLEAEMLVRRTDTQRCFIPDWTTDKVEEMYSLRALIEGHAATRAASRINDVQIAELRKFNDEIAVSIGTDGDIDTVTFAAANRSFHSVILEAAQSERLLMMRNLLFETSNNPVGPRPYDREQAARSHADHEELILSFMLHDADAARSLMENHIRHSFYRTYHMSSQDDRASNDEHNLDEAWSEVASAANG